MAEFVNQRVQDMVSELEQMKRIDLYDDEEIREISKKRTDYEYKIHRQTRCKEDYLKYIAYECLLIKDIHNRRQKTLIVDKKSNIEYAICKRVNKLYRELVFRFPSDLEIWLNYIKFCKNIGFDKSVTVFLEQMLQVHGDKPKVWQIACRWEFEEMNSIDTARKFILKGLHRHPESPELYVDALRIELLMAEKLSDESKDKQLTRAEIIIGSGLKHIKDVNFVVQLCSVVKDFAFATSIQSNLLSELWNKHDDKKEAWEFIALCELQELNTEEFNWRSLKDNNFTIKCPKNVANYFNVFETAHTKVDAREICSSYIKSAIQLTIGESYDTATKLQILTRALTKGHLTAQLNELHYKLLLDLLYSDTETSSDEITTLLEEASQNLPESEYIWEERLQRAKNNPPELLKIFKEARKAMPVGKGISLWSIVIECTKDSDTLKKLYNESLSLNQKVAAQLKPAFLNMFYKLGDVQSARSEYMSMVRMPPFVIELHKAMMDIEDQQKICDSKQIRNCHELATQQFGQKEPQVWLDYIQFELRGDKTERCGLIYKRACASLDNEIVDKFITYYSLNKNIVK